MSKVRVFVYGTLRKGFGNHDRYMGTAEFVGSTKTQPVFTMRAMCYAAFPGAFVGGSTALVGEVYLVDETTLRRLDEMEGHPYDYKREEFLLEDGSTAWIYARQYAYKDDPIVESGDWVVFKAMESVKP